MPPKKGGPSAPTIPNLQEGAAPEPLQAVILADSFNKRFQVLCIDRPRCLLPLLGTPLLAWTLESLILSGVKEVIVFCGVHAEAIKEWVTSSSYSQSLSIQCISSTSAQSVGDALRQLDAMQILNPKSPFLLLHSPVVSNMDLSRMVRWHKRLREEDKHLIMTVGVGVGGRRHPESPLFVVNPTTSHLLHYSPHPILPPKSRLHLPASLILDSPNPASLDLEIWSGTSSHSPSSIGHRDLGIDVCEADVPALFTENFDWQDMRRHLVAGVLGSELLGKKIGVVKIGERGEEGESLEEILGSGVVKGMGKGKYVERVRDTRTFADISRDVLRRWAFPLVPDAKILGQDDYELRRGTVYVATEGVRLARTTQTIGPALIGPHSTLSSNTTLHHSTLGRSCHIGPSTSIHNSYIFDNVSIGRHCVLKGCIIAHNVVIGDNVVIGKGALIGAGVRLGDGERIEEFERVGRKAFGAAADVEEEDEYADVPPSRELDHPDSEGFVWPMEDEGAESEDEDEVEDPYEHPDNKRLLQFGQSLSRISSYTSEGSTLSAASSAASPHSLASSTGLASLPSLSLNPGASGDFHVEVRLSLQRAVEEEHRWEDALLELRTQMLVSNVTVAGKGGAREEVVGFFMELVETDKGGKGAKEGMMKVWERWGELIIGIGVKPVDLLLEVQHFCISQPSHAPFFPLYLNALYDVDLAEYEDIVAWYKSEESRGKGEMFDVEAGAGEEEEWKKLWGSGGRFVKALAEAEEEDEDEESDEEEG